MQYESPYCYLPLPQFAVPHTFRLGCTSYIFPDTILANVRVVAPAVDDVELVLFESSNLSALPSSADIMELKQLADWNQLTYTVHFPLDGKLGSTDPEERTRHLRALIEVARLTQPLNPFAYVLHLEGIGATADVARQQEFVRDTRALLPELIASVGDPARICIENLSYPFEWCEPLLSEFGLSVCADIGHLWRYGYDVQDHLRRYRDRLRVVHLHGCDGEHDHQALTVMAPDTLKAVLSALDKFRGVLTLELFRHDAISTSIERLSECLNT